MHAYLAVFLSVAGVVANILCVMVLNRPQMKSPMNFLLTCLAAADGVGLAIYACIKTYLGIATKRSSRCHSEALEIFIRTFKIISGMSLAMNSWLTVGIAVSRYVIISSRSPGSVFNMKKAKITVLAAFLLTLFEHAAYLVMVKVEQAGNATCYFTGERMEVDKKVYRWSTFGFSFISASLLVIFSALLVSNLLRFTRNNNRNFSVRSAAVQENRRNQARKTTFVLLAMTVSAFLTESPFLMHTIYEEFMQTGELWYDNNLDDIWKILSILNSGMHILFLSICKNFRDTLKETVCKSDKQSANTSESQTMC